MLALLALALTTSFPADGPSVTVSVERFADLSDVSMSPLIAENPETIWAGMDRAVAKLPWAKRLLRRPDLISGWLQAYRECPLPKKDQFGSRFVNLESLLSYPPFISKEIGHEREIVVALATRSPETSAIFPNGICARLAKTAFPGSKMAHLFDGRELQEDGAFLNFSVPEPDAKFVAKKKAAEAELISLTAVKSGSALSPGNSKTVR